MLVAALNPCPCGYRTDPRRDCHCTPPQIERYMGKISGPLLDRIDLHLEVPAVSFRDLTGRRSGTGSAQMREVVVAARNIQQTRFSGSRTLRHPVYHAPIPATPSHFALPSLQLPDSSLHSCSVTSPSLRILPPFPTT